MKTPIPDPEIEEALYPWLRTDAGRSNSARPKQKNDCTVRALALVRGFTYDEAYDTLANAGRKCSNGFHIGTWLERQPSVTKISFPAIKGQTRMNPVKFAEQFPKGRFICRTAKHVYAVIDGVALDTARSKPNRCIYNAWRISTSAVIDSE